MTAGVYIRVDKAYKGRQLCWTGGCDKIIKALIV